MADDTEEESHNDETDELVLLARKEYGSPTLQVDQGETEISEGNDGIWVRAWVLLTNEQLRSAGIQNPHDEFEVDDASTEEDEP